MRNLFAPAITPLLLCAWFMTTAPAVSANVLTVTSLADSGPGSLRQTMTNALPGDIIKIQVVGTIVLTSGELTMAKAVRIDGPTTGQLIISGNNQTRVFNVTATAGKVVLNDLTIADGNAGNGSGGGINYVTTGATFYVSRCTFRDNAAGSSGGAIHHGSGTFNLSHCTLSNNFAAGAGGGIGNSGSLFVSNCTITANTTGGSGGGIRSDGAIARLANTIVAGNSASAGPDLMGNFTSFGSNLVGRSDNSAGITNGVNGDQVGSSAMPLDPQLSALADNGGATQTHALLPTSSAIDAGNDAQAGAYDQRGYGRNGRSDIGAFEFAGVAPIPQVLAAVSRKTHGAAGAFDIALPLTGPAGIECRTGAVNGQHQIVITFAAPVSVKNTSIVSRDGLASAGSNVNGAVVAVDLAAVANAQTLGITLSGVSDGTATGDIFVSMGVLAGDTNSDGRVNAADIGLVKSQIGQAVTGSTFRSDLNASGGTLNASDAAIAKFNAGAQLP